MHTITPHVPKIAHYHTPNHFTVEFSKPTHTFLLMRPFPVQGPLLCACMLKQRPIITHIADKLSVCRKCLPYKLVHM